MGGLRLVAGAACLLLTGLALGQPADRGATATAEIEAMAELKRLHGALGRLEAAMADPLQMATLEQWAAACDVRVTGGPGSDGGPPSVYVPRRRWALNVSGRAADIACFAGRLIGDGRMLALDLLAITPDRRPGLARGRLRAIEFTRPAPRPDDPPPGVAIDDVRTRQRLADLRAASARVAAVSWHVAAVQAFRRMAPVDAVLTMTPDRFSLGGELRDDDHRRIVEQVERPADVEWQLDALKPPRPPTELPWVARSGDVLRLDALDARADALAVLLGARLIALRRFDVRFTGRIASKGRDAALEALRGAQPRLAEVETRFADGRGPRVTVELVDVESGALEALLSQVAGRPVELCPASVRLTVGAREIPVDALEAALRERATTNPHCAGWPRPGHPAPGSIAPPAFDPHTWRLTATLRDGTMRKALFEGPGGWLYLVADRGHWDEEFDDFAPGRVVLPGPSVHVLEARRF